MRLGISADSHFSSGRLGQVRNLSRQDIQRGGLGYVRNFSCGIQFRLGQERSVRKLGQVLAGEFRLGQEFEQIVIPVVGGQEFQQIVVSAVGAQVRLGISAYSNFHRWQVWLGISANSKFSGGSLGWVRNFSRQ